MQKTVKIKCPAKINLDLRVFEKDPETGFHPIKSIMQTIGLYDYITLNLNDNGTIILDGNSDEIPYDENNLCYKAAKAYLDKTGIESGIHINIEKNIPVAAGLAGGSTDAAGVLTGLNKLFGALSDEEIFELAKTLGSDLNFCLVGGTALCQGRGEKIAKMPFYNFKLSLIKPKNLKISAKEAYSAFDELNEMSDMRNDLEFALLKTNAKTGRYKEIEYLNSLGFQMSGSGPTFFLRDKNINKSIVDENEYLIINDLNSVNSAVEIV